MSHFRDVIADALTDALDRYASDVQLTDREVDAITNHIVKDILEDLERRDP